MAPSRCPFASCGRRFLRGSFTRKLRHHVDEELTEDEDSHGGDEDPSSGDEDPPGGGADELEDEQFAQESYSALK